MAIVIKYQFFYSQRLASTASKMCSLLVVRLYAVPSCIISVLNGYFLTGCNL